MFAKRSNVSVVATVLIILQPTFHIWKVKLPSFVANILQSPVACVTRT